MVDVIGVPGVRHDRFAPDRLRGLWEPALRDGLEIATGSEPAPSFALAYYGDLFAQAQTLADAEFGVTKGATEDGQVWPAEDDDVAFLAAAADEVLDGRPALPDAPEWKGVAPVPPVLRPVLRRLTQRFDITVALTFIRSLHQVKVYTQDAPLAASIRAQVRATLQQGCTVVVAHSLGSVVTLEVLATHPELRVDTLVTVGSPLSMRLLNGRLPAAARRTVPPQLRRWVNVYDPADPVAGAGALGRLWPGVHDFEVSNGDDPHSSQRYLAKRATGRAVAQSLGYLPG
ncbi:alpha/beta fold hydrolase [Nakamurella endophytica]|uniref:alpha/beta fold hydrolase n=1 Tax=Nakamurella endophytica TaxID=1748367 RepID=UPI0016687F0F|nr:hypothetical protein [Nakamurella endophytica]